MNIYKLVTIVLLYLFSNYAQAEWETNVPGIQAKHLNAQYWINKHAAPDKHIMDKAAIISFNQKMLRENPYVNDPLAYPDSLSGDKLKAMIKQTSPRSSYPRFYPSGEAVTDEDWTKFIATLNNKAIAEFNPVTFGIAIKRSAMRTFPTNQRILNDGMDIDIDRFQESAVFPGEPVAILHSSADNKWWLVRNYNYTAWVEKTAIAKADRAKIRAFTKATKRLIVTGAKVFTTFVPDKPDISNQLLDMGVSLPLLSHKNFDNELYSQNTAYSHIVEFPTRDANGELVLKPALIAMARDVSTDYLAFTPTNLLQQAFKFLGERYGWGHDYNSRDCTGFLGDVFKTFGLIMPRNSSQQGKSDYAHFLRFAEGLAETEDTTALLSSLTLGDIIYLPGHVTLVIGNENGEPFMIHDVKGLAYMDEQDYVESTLNGVSVTPLTPLYLNADTRYIDRVYHIKRFGAAHENNRD
ncbi:C40 family peptidase [Alteromonas sp. ASW11-130]|uniref:C40 family peptidase n=1 Tax=Alteromonas sp. ASW11-130 TaxID=3015775 RepID=UPI00224241FC|nr:SH3 domain-containing protein [Alteromonas sp. ASW11-130]MCW8092946.1 SH3 domain-containing protein [Alteromonas sp. ASW11-130]